MKKTLLLLLILSCIQINAQCWKTAAAGYSHTVAIRTDGTLWTWGNNDQGQLGTTSPATQNVPTKMGTSNDWNTVAAGWGHTVALKTDGSLWAWGYGGLGQIGNGSFTPTNFSPPQQIGVAKNWQTIVTGHGHTVALKTDGTLWAWGNNFSGQLGNGTTLDKNIPTQVGTASDWQTVVAGMHHTVALKKDGTLWAWGKNALGELGDGTTTNRLSPKQIGTATDWKTIAAGSDHTIAIKTDGTLWIWGDNTSGALGDGTTVTKNVPTQIGMSTDWKTLNGGVNYTMAVKTDGSLWGWGNNSNGKFGNGTIINSLIPVQIGTESNWQIVDGGAIHTVAIKSDESLWTWGSNSLGQLGDGTSTDKNIPTLLNCLGSLILQTSQANITCFGDTTGSASITAVSGGTVPYTYLWSNGKTTSSITGLAAGEYSCTVKDAASLSITKTFTITQPALLNLIITATNSACNVNNGSITAMATGGTLPYQYAISSLPYQSSNVFTGLSAGNYDILVRDNNGCITSNIITITDNNTPPPTANAQALINTATVANLKANGINLKWYDVPVVGTALNLSTVLQTGTYYVSQTIDGCESLMRTSVNVTIIEPSGNEQIPTNGLVAYYPFNGNANDASGNESNGTVTAATLTSDRFGNSNTAYSFDGVSSYIDAVIPNIPKNNAARTISGWFKTNDAFSDPNKYDASIFNYGTLAKLQRLSLSVYRKGYLDLISGTTSSTDDFYVDNFDYANNDWYFFTATYDGTKLSIYVNGKYVDQKAVSLNTVGNIFRIGQRISGDNVKEGFKGTIDDIAIWNRVLTPEEIAAMYTPGEQPQYTLIPDPYFEQKLINLSHDHGVIDGKVLTSNIKKVTSLDVSSSTISDLTGIQDFVSLTNLNCAQNGLKTLNVSKNTALTILDCNNNQITALDVSNNIALLNLSCYANQLTALDVSKNTALTKLDSGSNKYTALDVSSNTALTFLGCNTSQLTSLDVSKNTALKLLDCRENKLNQLDVSKITTLTELYCQSNQLTNLDISKNKSLEFLNCSKNQLTTIDVSVNTALVGLYSNSNQLTSLNLKNANNVKFESLNFTNNPNLTCIQVDDVAYANTNWSAKKDVAATFNTQCEAYTLIPDINFEKALIAKGIDSGTPDGKVLTANITSVTDLDIYNSSITDLTGIEAFSFLEVLNCGKNQISSLDFSQNIKLKQLDCYENKLTNLNVTQNPDLWYLDCFTNKLTTLDLSQNKLLQIVYCYDNILTSLNVSNLKNLESLDCPDNQLVNLDVSTNTALKELHCHRNKLQSLDVSKNVALYDVVCYSNELTYLNLKNGNNTNFVVGQYTTIFTNNPNLTCIQVDDAAYANTNWSTKKDVAANYSTDCSDSFVIISDSNFEQKLIDLGIDTDGLNGKTTSNLNSITSLDLSNSNISDLSGIEYFTSLTYLDVSNNKLTSLDVSNNGLLETLNASSNQLTTLDLSNNTKLTIVYVANNPLVSLNLKNGNNKNFILPTQTGKNAASVLYTTFLGLTSLGCIQVDDADYSNVNWSNIKESTTTYANTCKTLGVDDTVFTKATIYPNPTNGEVNISNIILEKATIYNQLGQLVKTFTLNSNNTNNTINLSELPKGIYYIYLINGDAASAKKIIVE